jgi:hypothetical protein
MRGLVGSRSKTLLLVVAGLVCVVSCRAAAPARSGASASPPPRLVISIVVDQFPAWEAAERLPLLPDGGGFARLRREGLYLKELRYAHASTDTAAGHAALYTGGAPRDSGLAANEVLGHDDKPQSILRDEKTRLVATNGAMIDRPGSSLARLRLETLADVLVGEIPGARVYSFSLKDRGALPGAGRRPTAALWLDVPSGQLVTSTLFPTPPAWTTALGDARAVAAARAGGWSLDGADGRFVAEHARTTDDQDGEGDLDGLGRQFPHAVPSAKALRATPLGDRLLLALARAAIANLGTGAAPTLLALSLSSNDYVQHVFGPDSWEAWAELVELDRGLAELFAAADRAVGPQGWAALLTSDHGGGPLPEVTFDLASARCAGSGDAPPDRWERACEPRRRLDAPTILTTIEAAIVAELGPGPWVRGFAEPLVYLTPRGRALAGADRARMVRAAAAAMQRLGVRAVEDTRVLRESCGSVADSLGDLVCRAIDPDGPGDLYLVLAPTAFFEADLVPGFGTNHGSPYLYDRAVPLIVRAPGRVTAGAVREAPADATAFARTAASLLGIRAPAAAGAGEDLTR